MDLGLLQCLISSGEAERRKLFRTMTGAEARLLGLTGGAGSDGGPASTTSDHPAMFACIMRRRTVMNDIHDTSSEANKVLKMSLECHAFICRSQADAIAIAAQLYQALVETIRRNNAEINNGKNSCRVRYSSASNKESFTTLNIRI